MKRTFIRFFGVIGIIVLITGIIAFYVQNIPYKDQNGFIHNKKSTVEENTAPELNYKIADIEKFDFEDPNTHAVLNTITPILERNKDKDYTTFRFPDGTGLYFPESDIHNAAFYGMLNKKGEVEHEYGTLLIEGTKFSYTPSGPEVSELSSVIASKIPAEYKNDATWVVFDEAANTGSINLFAGPDITDADALNVITTVMKEIQDLIPANMPVEFTVNNYKHTVLNGVIN